VEQELIQIFELLVALVAAVAAYWQHRQKKQVVVERAEAIVEKEVAEALQWAAESEKDDVVAYFDPDDDSVTRPPEAVRPGSWKMSDETKCWVTAGHSPEEQASLLKQIAEAEEKKKIRYIISVPGAYYEIEYGLVKGGGKGG
jgi:ATP phosphoribosyltransferase